MSLPTRTKAYNSRIITKPALIVDLDGTLIKTDLLFEGFLLLLRKNVFFLFPCFLWLFKGRAFLKCNILERVQLPVELLPFNEVVLDFLKQEFATGRQLILATASPMAIALKVSEVYPIFDKVYGTEGSINLKGKFKSDLLIKEFGRNNFDYIGNSHAGFPIFASSNHSYLVNAAAGVKRRAKKVKNLSALGTPTGYLFKKYIKAIRMHQWVKNLLIFIPIITSHSVFSKPLLLDAVAGFFAFSFIASSGYIINDLFDLNSDRSHPRKKFRPFASGHLSIQTGTFLGLFLFACGFFLGSLLNSNFLLILLFYFIATLSYSLYFKRKALYDVFILALLYSVRIIAGGLVTGIPLSSWLILFSAFIFLSLAFVKRYSELMLVSDDLGLKKRGREYFMEDIAMLQIMGIASGFLSVVIFSLYIDSAEVVILYKHPQILWGISLLLLFWISRVWMITNRGKMNDDPIIFALKDRTSHVICILSALIIFFSR